MVSLKETPKRSESMLAEPERAYYPSLYLDGDAVKKLGFDKADIGETYEITFKCKVTSKSISETEKTDKAENVSLSLLSADPIIDIDGDGRAEKLYGPK